MESANSGGHRPCLGPQKMDPRKNPFQGTGVDTGEQKKRRSSGPPAGIQASCLGRNSRLRGEGRKARKTHPSANWCPVGAWGGGGEHREENTERRGEPLREVAPSEGKRPERGAVSLARFRTQARVVGWRKRKGDSKTTEEEKEKKGKKGNQRANNKVTSL